MTNSELATDWVADIPPVFEKINGKPALQLPGPGYLVSDFAENLGKLLAPHGIFSRKGKAFTLDHEGQKLELVTPVWLRTWLENHVSPFKLRASGEGQPSFKLTQTITEDTAKAVLASSQFLHQLPQVERFHPCPMPWKRRDGTIKLLSIGLDEQSSTYTADPGFNIEPMGLVAAREIIDSLLEEFAWPNDGGRSKAVSISAMLTVFAGGIMDQGATRPVFLYVANAEGSGKTTLAQLAGLPYQTIPVETAPPDEAEWQKKLLSVVMSGRRLLLLDNLKGRLNSGALEAYTTSPHYTGRILGVSGEFSGEAGATVLITGNGLTVTGDLRRRCLLVELFLTEFRSEDRKFKRTLDPVAMKEKRREVLCALWGFVYAWNEAGRPKSSKGNASFPRWCDTIGGIVEHAGYGCPTAQAQVEGMGDTDSADFAKLVSMMDTTTRYQYSLIEEMVIDAGLFEWLTSRDQGEGLPSGQKKQLSSILTRYKDRHVRDSKIFRVHGNGHGRVYFLE
jgi:hypothetical protein